MPNKIINKVVTFVQITGIGLTVIVFSAFLYFLLFWNNEKVLKQYIMKTYEKENEAITIIAEEMENYPVEHIYYDEEEPAMGDEQISNNCCDIINRLIEDDVFLSIEKNGAQIFFLKYGRLKKGYGLLYSQEQVYNKSYANIEHIDGDWYYCAE